MRCEVVLLASIITIPMSPSFLSRGILVRHQLTRAPPRHTASTLAMMSSSSSSSSSSQADVVIAGGGMVGSAAAAAIGKLGKQIIRDTIAILQLSLFVGALESFFLLICCLVMFWTIFE